MTHTQFDPADHIRPWRPATRRSRLARRSSRSPRARGWAGSAGAIWSTPSDLLAWDMALIGGKVLADASYRTLTTPRHSKDGRSTGYGCGDGIIEQGPAVVFKHGGAVSGFVAENIVVPATRSAIVMLANTDFASLGPLEDGILDQARAARRRAHDQRAVSA